MFRFNLLPISVAVHTSEPRRFLIYVHVNKINGKKYVGQTRTSLEWRWQQHVFDALNDKPGCRVFNAAIRKYGPDNFEHEVVETVFSIEDANAAEVVWITKLNSRAPNGYNLKPGGNVKGDLHPETRAKLSASSRAAQLRIPIEVRRAQGAARMAKKTTEEKSRAALKAWANSSQERRDMCALRLKTRTDSVKQKTIEATKKHWASLSKEERFDRSSGRRRRWWATMTPEQRSEIGRKLYASFTPEQKENLRQGAKNIPTEVRSKIMFEANARMTPEARQERSLRAWDTKRAKGQLSFMSTEDRSAAAKRGCSKLTAEQLSERSRKAHETMRSGGVAVRLTPEQADVKLAQRLRRIVAGWALKGFQIGRRPTSNEALSNMRTAQRRRRFKEAVVNLSKADVDLASIGYGC